jgi:Sec-independent protein translocase protein TatA
MDFLGIGPLEIFVVFIIILLILGPKQMVKTGKTLGQILRNIFLSDTWKGLNRISREIRTLPTKLTREAELEKLNKELDIERQIAPLSEELKEYTNLDVNTDLKPSKKQDQSIEPDDTPTPLDKQE